MAQQRNGKHKAARPNLRHWDFEKAAKSPVPLHMVSFPLLPVPPGDLPDSVSDTELACGDKTPTSYNSTSEETWEYISGGQWLPDWHKLWGYIHERLLFISHRKQLISRYPIPRPQSMKILRGSSRMSISQLRALTSPKRTNMLMCDVDFFIWMIGMIPSRTHKPMNNNSVLPL